MDTAAREKIHRENNNTGGGKRKMTIGCRG